MVEAKEAVKFLESEMAKKEKGAVLNFDEYLVLVQKEPKRMLRDIFQLFYDMVKSSVGKAVNEYPDDPESIGFLKYDCAKLFVEGADNPFFADRLFANRFMSQMESLRQGFQQNRIYVHDGPSGCGKSTFLNNLLNAFERYTNTREGQIYEMFWEIELDQEERVLIHKEKDEKTPERLQIYCPSHDYPMLVIPKEYRTEFLKKLLPEKVIQEIGISREKEYEWLFQGEACTICKSIFGSLFSQTGSLERVLSMIKARPYKFDRRLGEGISVFNPGDRPTGSMGANGQHIGGFFTNPHLQEKLNQIFTASPVKYAFSHMARTNNGIYVLMDVKGHNQDRLLELHNVISEGVHKVGDIEERAHTLFFALMNPEDKDIIKERKMESFEGRIQYNKIPYVLEPATEVSIYSNIFGTSIQERFLPDVLGNFARVIIASRMNDECQPLEEWIPSLEKYERYCDKEGRLLRMEIYGGVIPAWLSDKDRKKFTAPLRRALIAGGENEGGKGISGRDSLRLLNEFFSRYGKRVALINMDNVVDFFKYHVGKDFRDAYIPKHFLSSLVNSYDYTVLNKVKEALYAYNTEQVARDILTYLWVINHDIGARVKCDYTGEEIEVTLNFLTSMSSHLTGKTMSEQEALEFARYIQKKYVVTKAQERVPIKDTELYRGLFADYVKHLKENVLKPFIENPNFRVAIKTFGTQEFDTFDTRLKEHIICMLKNLREKFGYTDQGAKEICLYVIDRKLSKKFS